MRRICTCGKRKLLSSKMREKLREIHLTRENRRNKHAHFVVRLLCGKQNSCDYYCTIMTDALETHFEDKLSCYAGEPYAPAVRRK